MMLKQISAMEARLESAMDEMPMTFQPQIKSLNWFNFTQSNT